MLAAKLALEFLPNVHLTAALISAYTLVYRRRALIPLYVFVLLEGLISGFPMWWLPYLYIWLPLWGGVMLLSRLRAAGKFQVVMYCAACGLHGLTYGLMYAPAQAVMFRLSFHAMTAWIAAGLPFDVVHGIGNVAAGTLILPLAALLRRLERMN
jgi:energy-coupling factor transport system substrate-specific component